MASWRGDASTSVAGKGKKNVQPREVVGRTELGKSIEQLNVREFRESFCIPIGIPIRLLSGNLVSTEQEPDAIIFSKEHFNVGLWFPLPSLFKQFLHFTKILSSFLHPNVVRVLMAYSILSMLYHLDLPC